jgi:hypothetical protein
LHLYPDKMIQASCFASQVQVISATVSEEGLIVVY